MNMCIWRMIDSFAQHMIVEAMQQHKERCKSWKDGRISKYWMETDKNGMTVLCIQYESGHVWHYHRAPQGNLISIY